MTSRRAATADAAAAPGCTAFEQRQSDRESADQRRTDDAGEPERVVADASAPRPSASPPSSCVLSPGIEPARRGDPVARALLGLPRLAPSAASRRSRHLGDRTRRRCSASHAQRLTRLRPARGPHPDHAEHPQRRLRRPRRRGRPDRQRRLGARRRDGQPLRAQPDLRPDHGRGAGPRHRRPARRAPDDRGRRPQRAGVRRGRLPAR